MKYTREATRQDAAKISSLRQNAYARATEFKVIRPELIDWSKKDDEQIVLSAWDGDELISTMRGVIVYDYSEAEEALTCTVDINTGLFPALVLTKGATAKEYAASGLNSVLRYYFLRACLEDSEVNSVLGLVYTGAPRTHTMAALGYVFQPPTRIWDPADITIKPGLLAVLSRSRIAAAGDMLRQTVVQPILEYPWIDSDLNFSRLHKKQHNHA
jgi:hypothetical protein